MLGSTSPSWWQYLKRGYDSCTGRTRQVTLLLRLENQPLLRRRFGRERFKLALALISLRLGKTGPKKVRVIGDGLFAIHLGRMSAHRARAAAQGIWAHLQQPICRANLEFTPIFTGVLTTGPGLRRDSQQNIAERAHVCFDAIGPLHLGRICTITTSPDGDHAARKPRGSDWTLKLNRLRAARP